MKPDNKVTLIGALGGIFTFVAHGFTTGLWLDPTAIFQAITMILLGKSAAGEQPKL